MSPARTNPKEMKMRLSITPVTITEALGRGDPVVENFVCESIVGVSIDPFDVGEFAVDCMIAGHGQQRVYVTVGHTGLFYGDI